MGLIRIKQTIQLLIILAFFTVNSSCTLLLKKKRGPTSLASLSLKVSYFKKIQCYKGQDKQIIFVKTTKQSCKVFHKINNKQREIGFSSSGDNYCFEIATRIANELKEDNFTCDIQK